MSDAHEIVTLGGPVDGWVGVKVECSACNRVEFTATWQNLAEVRERWMADHIAQHAPGRALDIEVDWEPSACCSVCDDGLGDIRQTSTEVLECGECGTTWNLDGTMGETDE